MTVSTFTPSAAQQLFLALMAAVVVTSCKPAPKGPPAQPIPEVTTITVKRQEATLRTELPGRTAAFRIAEIRPQVNGLILKRLFTEGADVKEGQDLYQIDPAPFQAALDNAKAALGRAEANLPALQSRANRYREALEAKAVSRQQLDDAEAALNQAQADIQYYKAMTESARISLGYTRVVSPISGRIGRSSVTDGAIVTAYQPVPLATIQQLDPMYVDVPQSTTELLYLRERLQQGELKQNADDVNEVRLLLGNGKEYPLPGTLQFRDVSVDTTTASVILRMVFPNTNNLLLPGMFVRAVLTEGSTDKAILIPQQAVQRDAKGNPITLVVDDTSTAQQRALTVGRAIGDQWLVTKGLAPGERVIVEGVQRVRPGSPVKETTPGAPKAPAASTAAPGPQSPEKKQ